MRFRFNERKSAQAAAYLLKRHGGCLNYMVLIKLLYLADRKTLLEHGQLITGDQMVSMPHGPVLSRIYDRIAAGMIPSSAPWSDYISDPSNYDVQLVCAEPSTDELSRYELRVLDEVDARYGSLGKWALRDLTHELPEWEDPHGSSLPIDPTTILQAAGHPPDEIERIASEAEELWFLGSLAEKRA